uniref:EGF-like domain-containing protein n=1 Tax=Magallana gigas TaxID=29159 RepID=A0A8W8P5G3_MAGGI
MFSSTFIVILLKYMHRESCLKLGYYGENCSTPCPENCENGDCDIVDGTCISCVPGYRGSMCNKACEGKYGMNCSKVCGACYGKEQCDYKNGTCPSGSEDGYKGRQCKTVCNNNTYGPNCSMTCGHCLYLYGEKCNHVTGQCPRGCASGFQGDLCVESIDDFKNKTTIAWPTYNGCLKVGYYGENCSTPCPENCENGDCDIVDGTCISCVPGYKGSMCNKACEGKYGMNCSKVCGACYEKEQCDYKNGTCPSGCEDGYKGRQCKTVCNNNTYGPNCSKTCGHCIYLYGEKCNHVTGQCPRGCASGFQGDLCVESRDEFKNKTTVAWPTYNGCLKVGYYGENCSTPCPENCENGDCDIVDGTCNSCVPGYRGSMCNKGCLKLGYYGENCSTPCPENCENGDCDIVDWTCISCVPGYRGCMCNKAHVPSVSQTTVQVPVYSIITVVVLFSGSAILNLIFISRKALLRCRNREEKVDESVEKSYTYVDSINVLENGCAAHQELEHFDKKENDDIYNYVE